MTTDEEQDLLRAMLVMSAAGLDAVSKQLVRDALPLLVERDERAQDAFQKFISRRLKGDSSSADDAYKLLAKVLSQPSAQVALVGEYVKHLTRGSLQSADALYETTGALGIWPGDVSVERDRLQPIFDTRNSIVHELDIDLSAERRNRKLRSRAEMLRGSDSLLNVAQKLLAAVDTKLL